MSDHKQHDKQHEGTTAVAEQPKTKVGDKPEAVAKTKVDKPEGEKKERKAPVRRPKNVEYRILDGVESAKFSGQRGHVIRALQSLAKQHGPEKHHTFEQVVGATEGLTTRDTKENSVGYHLNLMIKDGLVASHTPPAPAKEETKAA